VECGKIQVDYAGIACKRYLDRLGIQHNAELRHRMGLFPDECKRMLARYFKCPVYMYAQLSGAVAGAAPGVIANRTDTAENKLLLENADFGLTIGNMTPEGMAVATLQKARRAKYPRNTVIRVNGLFCRIDDVSSEYVFDGKRRRIIPREELSRLDGGTTLPSRQIAPGITVRTMNKVESQQRAVRD
jgi:hypothetical protein